jgi:hypothetical protein
MKRQKHVEQLSSSREVRTVPYGYWRRWRTKAGNPRTAAILGYSKIGQVDVDEWLKIPEGQRQR